MLIDWFTVIAQIVNFLILVWLMKRYLYQPILNAIDAREKRIAAQLSDAETKAGDAAKERALFAQKNQTLDADRASLIKAAQDQAKAEGLKLMAGAREEADAMRAKRNEALVSESKALEQELATVIQNEVLATARQTLAELADASLEAQMSKLFIQRLMKLDAPSKTALLDAVRNAPQSIRIQSAFALALPEQDAILNAMQAVTGVRSDIKFELSPGLICGIELNVNGQKLAWSVSANLHALASHIDTWLAPAIGTGPIAKPASDAVA